MNWLNIELSTLRSEEYLGSEPTQRATWLNLVAYCADQENGGIISGCKEWGSRRWLQLLGITKEEVYSESKLWIWKGENIAVWNYPKSQEIAVKIKRSSGKKGGRPRKDNDTSDDKPHGYEDDKPHGSVSLKRKEKEGKEKEGKEKECNNKFTKPSVDEAKAYFSERGKVSDPSLEAEKFVDHFTSNGWKVGGKTAMRDWKSAVRNWEKRNAPTKRPEDSHKHLDPDKDYKLGFNLDEA